MAKVQLDIKNPSWGRFIRRIGKLVRETSVSTRDGLFVFMPKIISTTQTLKLAEELNKRGIKTELEYWDGHKHIDIYLPDVPLNIEINGLQHYTNPTQIISDFNRVYYSDQSKCHTFSITNQLIETRLKEIADAIEGVAKNLTFRA